MRHECLSICLCSYTLIEVRSLYRVPYSGLLRVLAMTTTWVLSVKFNFAPATNLSQKNSKYNEYFFGFLPSGTLTSHPLLRASEKVIFAQSLIRSLYFSLVFFFARVWEKSHKKISSSFNISLIINVDNRALNFSSGDSMRLSNSSHQRAKNCFDALNNSQLRDKY